MPLLQCLSVKAVLSWQHVNQHVNEESKTTRLKAHYSVTIFLQNQRMNNA
jgi:hypothetical protein